MHLLVTEVDRSKFASSGQKNKIVKTEDMASAK